MNLIRYDSVKENEYISYIQEWEEEGKTIIPGASDRRGRSLFEMINKWNFDETDENDYRRVCSINFIFSNR